ncbi:MAG: type I-B CRISPR-associated protein Cas5 [Acidobacteria bacterium]|jgi:CRISPR-associated protein Cas5t|nr:MAG: type I-B CRISPR-associated protein Cas5 [Acidobacteriota bacterium]
MELPKLLKFELFVPTACFKTPFSVKGIETYPLPPYSTIIGILYTALGEEWKGERFDISIQGNYEAIFRDYIRFRKYNFKDKKLESLPLSVPTFYKFELKVHLEGDENLLKKFKNALEKPKTYLYLSGGEYPLKIKGVRFVYAEEKRYTLREPATLKAGAFVPETLVEKSGISTKESIHYKVPYFLKSLQPREHCWVDVYYYPKDTDICGKNLLVDNEGDLVWLCCS